MQIINPFYEKIILLANSIHQSNAVSNKFYELWMTEKLNYKQLAIFAVNYYYRVSPTVDRIIMSLIRVNDIEARKNMVENIADEIGLRGKPHPELLKIFLNALLTKTAKRKIELDQISRDIKTRETKNLVEKGKRFIFS